MVGKDSYRRTLVSGQSARLICGYIYASAGEGESTQDLVFGGQNMIAENGSMLAESRRLRTALFTVRSMYRDWLMREEECPHIRQFPPAVIQELVFP